MANTTLSITYGSAGNRNKWTWSGWVKRSKLGGHQTLWSRYADSNNIGDLRFQSDDGFTYQNYSSGSTNAQWNASGKFRDTNGWYHIVFVWDSGNATAADRIKAYLNGENMVGSASTTPSQDLNSIIGSAAAHKIGSRNSDQYFDGLISHVHFCDGYAYSPTDFGSTDATTGEWKINTSPSVSYGTNGFFILKDGNSVTDQSGNSNNFSVAAGTLTKTEDCPSNVFATLNPLVNIGTTTTYSQGNNTVSTSNANYKVSPSTLAVSSGKYYMEFKAVSGSHGDVDAGVGIIQTDTVFSTSSQNLNAYTNGYSYSGLGKVRQYNASDVYTASTYTDGDIIGIALDMDNNKLYFHKNGTYQNSGVPTSGSTGTGAVSITSGKEYYFACSTIASGGTKVFSANFGNGYFGTTAVSSAGTNASNNGIFEYDVPNGYTALSTKGLNE